METLRREWELKREPVVCDSRGPREGGGPRQANGWGAIFSDAQKTECWNYSDEASGEGHSACSDSGCLNNNVLLRGYGRGKDSREHETEESGL